MESQLELIRRISGPYHLVTYFLVCAVTRKTIVIDPGDTAGSLLEVVRENRLEPVALVMTHGHADPYFSAEQFKREWDIPYCIHGEDDAFSGSRS